MLVVVIIIFVVWIVFCICLTYLRARTDCCGDSCCAAHRTNARLTSDQRTRGLEVRRRGLGCCWSQWKILGGHAGINGPAENDPYWIRQHFQNNGQQQQQQTVQQQQALSPAVAVVVVPMTMKKKVDLIAEQLGLDVSLPLVKKVVAANEAMGVEPTGSIAQQVDALMIQLGL